jgi:hypothetical protein
MIAVSARVAVLDTAERSDLPIREAAPGPEQR